MWEGVEEMTSPACSTLPPVRPDCTSESQTVTLLGIASVPRGMADNA